MLLFAVYGYLGLYLALAIANVIYALAGKLGFKLLLLIYELFSGLFVVFMAAALWNPMLKALAGPASACVLLIVVAVDVRFSVWGKPEDYGLSKSDLGDAEMDMIKGISLAFAAPAYMMGLLLAIEIVMKSFFAA